MPPDSGTLQVAPSKRAVLKPQSIIKFKNVAAKLWLEDAKDFLASLKRESVDLVLTSPPYFIGKEYDSSRSVDAFRQLHREIFPLAIDALKEGGSLCWQVGYHVEKNQLVPLDALVYEESSRHRQLKLRNRIVWHFGHGFHLERRFSGRHETVLWFTKGDDYYFDLDSVRVAQKYPGKKHYKGPQRGELSGNPLGKNPGDIWDFNTDVWDIPNVKASHIEKTEHPCQYPVALASRLIRALSPPRGVIVDPYMGSGSTAVAAAKDLRNFLGCDNEKRYFKIAQQRLELQKSGRLRLRADTPAIAPNGKDAVAKRPSHFKVHSA